VEGDFHVLRIRSKKSAAGQTMVEFLISVIVIMFFLFLMLSLAILMVTSEYLEYAAFMAARTYRTGYSTAASQKQRADLVARQYVANVGNLLSGVPNIEVIDGNETGVPNLANVGPKGAGIAGVRISYRMPLFYLPPVFAGSFADPNISLVTESFYGRDPSADEACGGDDSFFRRFLQRVAPNLNGTNPALVAGQMEDNGC